MPPIATDPMPTEYAVLGLLMDGPKHGYDLARRFAPETALGEICRLEMSMLYAVLKKQEKNGHIEAELKSQGARPPKRTFHLTAMGRANFIEWVRTPVNRLRDVQPDLLIKLYFAWQLGDDDVLALIDRQTEICNTLLDRFQRGESLSDDAGDADYISNRQLKRSHPRPNEHELARDRTPKEELFSTIVRQQRIRQTEALIAWLKESRRKLGGY
jgi:PadR family transcriptional regulator, regulatory protein AphA